MCALFFGDIDLLYMFNKCEQAPNFLYTPYTLDLPLTAYVLRVIVRANKRTWPIRLPRLTWANQGKSVFATTRWPNGNCHTVTSHVLASVMNALFQPTTPSHISIPSKSRRDGLIARRVGFWRAHEGRSIAWEKRLLALSCYTPMQLI